jgi:6-phosphogluconolactonase (cycloisomerase 2 family)
MISRRGLLQGAAALALPPPRKRWILAYVGSYTSPQGPEGSHGNGQGIYLFQMNSDTGALTPREVFPNPSNPSWLALDSAGTHLYSANETADGSIGAYSVNPENGHLTLLNTVGSEGAGPAHLSIHPSAKYVLAANYAGGTIAVLPILSGGELGPATDVKHDQGSVGPVHAASAPPGSFAISGHDTVHAHMIQADPSGRFVLAADLALDRILIWKFDAARGTLSANDPPWVALPPGDGPRHFTFHPHGRWLYSLQEEASTLVTFDYDAARGRLTPKQTVSTLPKGFAGTSFTSELRVSPDARFVYAANRLHDTIAWFSIGGDGSLTLVGEEWTRGDYPRSFTIDPTGGFLYTCNQRSDAVACFRVNRITGALTFTGQYTAVGTPSIVVFLP